MVCLRCIRRTISNFIRNKNMNRLIKLNETCQFYPYDGCVDKHEFIIRTPNNRQFKISALAKNILERLDGETSLEKISAELETQSIYLTVEELSQVIDKEYRKLNIFEHSPFEKKDHPSLPASEKKTLPLLLHWDIIPEKVVIPISTRLQFLFKLPVAVFLILLIVITHYVLYFHDPLPRNLPSVGFLWVVLLSLLSVLCHEFGHSSGVSRYGGKPGRIGFGLYVLLPTFYADVSDIWRFRRKHRMIVDLGGVYFQEIAFAVFAIIGIVTSAPEFLIVCRFIDLMVLLTLNPVFQFDGYWFLADYLGLPNLYRLALRCIRHSLKRAFKQVAEPFNLPPLRRHAYVIFLIYALLCNVFLVAILFLGFRYVYVTFARFPLVFPWIYKSMIFALKTQDLLLFLNRAVALFLAIAFPATAFLGLYKYTVRIGGYCLAKIQSPKPFQRGLSIKP
jgi:putative peptide zinc metalloprotease protein